MEWYIAKIVFSITAENTPHKPQFDEQLRLVAASNMEEAYRKARMLGISEEDSFLNDRQNTVKWEFLNVTEIIPVRKLEDGAELYSHIHETDEAREYIYAIHQRADLLRTHSEIK